MRVWKYNIPIKDHFSLLLPENAEILSFGVQNEQPNIWVLVRNVKPLIERKFRFCGTGHEISEYHKEKLKFIGTVMMMNDSLVWHLFEIID